MRDSQKQRVYEAERRLRTMLDNCAESGNPTVELNGIRLTLPPEARYGSVQSVQTYVDRVLAHPAVIDRWPARSRQGVRVRPRRGDRHAHYQWGEIAVPDGRNRWAMREVVILHELAHHFAPLDAHGPGFVAVFIELLSTVMAPEVGLALRLLCAAGDVKESA